MPSGYKLTQDEFIQKANLIHCSKYDYSKTKFINSKTKITITCLIHGDFYQIANDHLRGHGCKKCADELLSINKSFVTEEFIQKASQIHENKYDYSKVNYINNYTKVKIICPIHGEFEQQPKVHLRGCGCTDCSVDFKKLSLEDFLKIANQIHNNKYDYNLIKYKNGRTKIKIICNIKGHGIFEQNPSNHLQGNGCPKCNESKGENKITNWLESNNIKFIKEYKFENCINPKTNAFLRFDFYLPEFETCIEYDGQQHFTPYSFTSKKSKEIMDKNLQDLQYRDQIKNQYCKENNIKLLKIPYWKIKNIEKILERIFLK